MRNQILTCDICGYVDSDKPERRMSLGALNFEPGPAYRFDVCVDCIRDVKPQSSGIKTMWEKMKQGLIQKKRA